MPKVSVVVPVYNVEKYLDKCLNSLVYQTLDDIEIIVVNDSSPDNSQEIIDKYVKAYPSKVKAYIKKNGGVGDARNFGIKKATGDYIGFVDGDDYVSLDMYKEMYSKAVKDDFDIVVCDIRYVFNDGKSNIVSSLFEHDLITKEEIKMSMVNMYPVVWNKIYKRNILNDICFKKGVWYEDVDFLYKLFPFISNIGVKKKPFVNYVQHSISITHTFDERVYDYVKNFNELIDFYKERELYNDYYFELEFVYVRYLYMTFIRTCCNFDKKEFKKACLLVKENVLKNFPNYKKNKYIKGLSGFYLKHFNFFTQNLVYLFYHYKALKGK